MSLPSTSMTRRAPLELAFVPRGVEEPLLGYYSVTPLTPGGWADLLGDVGLPDTLRRLSQTVAVGDSHRTRRDALPRDAAGDGPPPDRARRAVERVGARLAAGRPGRRAVGSGGRRPPPTWAGSRPRSRRPGTRSSSATRRVRPAPEAATDAIAGFVDAATRALSAAVRDPRIMRAPEAHADIVDLGMLQPLLRAVAPGPRPGAAARPAARHARAAPPAARGAAPTRTPAGRFTSIPPIRRSSGRRRGSSPPLARAGDGHVTLGQQGVVELRLAASALEFAGRGGRAAVRAGRGAGPRARRRPSRIRPGRAVARRRRPLRPARVARRARDQRRGVPGARRCDAAARAGRRGVAGAQGPRARPRQGPGGDRAPRLVDAGDDRARRGARRALRGARHGGRGGRSQRRARAAGRPASRPGATSRRVEPPEAFQGELRPYQKVGLGWLTRTRELGLGALLADDMGLGKTVQVIAYLLDHGDGVSGPALIVCPTSVLGNWQRELHRFAPDLAVHIHHGPDRTRDAEELADWDVVLTSYALLPRDRRLLIDGSVARARARRGAGGQEPAHPRRPDRQAGERPGTVSP